MKLSQKEVTLYYKLVFHLQSYILKKIDKNSSVNSVNEYVNLSMKRKLEIRDELWSNTKWIDEFIEKNPDALVEEEIEIIKRWKNPLKGTYLIERILKKYTVFISTNSEVYGVLGLADEIENVIDKRQLPVYVETVLLPFKDSIIYDGLLSKYSISFGRGLRDIFKATYNSAKENNQIITSL